MISAPKWHRQHIQVKLHICDTWKWVSKSLCSTYRLPPHCHGGCFPSGLFPSHCLSSSSPPLSLCWWLDSPPVPEITSDWRKVFHMCGPFEIPHHNCNICVYVFLCGVNLPCSYVLGLMLTQLLGISGSFVIVVFVWLLLSLLTRMKNGEQRKREV